MPCIRSPPQPRRSGTAGWTSQPAQVHVASLDESEDTEFEQENEARDVNRVARIQQASSKLISTTQARRNSFSGPTRRSPSITVLPDNTTRIWELEGEVSRLEREKRFLEESRQTQSEEYEQRLSDLKKDLTGQLEAEKRRNQRELESSNAKWRAEFDDVNARHEKEMREQEKKMAQMCESIKVETSTELGAKLEAAERDCDRLKHRAELLALEVKEKESLQKRIEFLESELKQSREQASSTLLQVRQQAETSIQELKQAHAQDLASKLDALRAQLRQEYEHCFAQDLEMTRTQAANAYSKQLSSALESLRHELGLQHARELQTAVEACRVELKANYEREVKILEVRAAEERTRSADPTEIRNLRENLRLLQAQNESLRTAMQREQEEHACNIRQKVIEMELAQQRNDEAIARALSIVKKTEARITHAVSNGTRSRPSSPNQAPSARRMVRGLAASPSRTTTRFMRETSSAPIGAPRYLSPTQSSLARAEAMLSDASRW